MIPVPNLENYLNESAARHSHLCPRQVLGVRVALAGLAAFGWDSPPIGKRLMVILETDGCFADGVQIVSRAQVGKRTLRVEDYGKTAGTFVDTHCGAAIRVAPLPGIRESARRYATDEKRRYFAQLLGYQRMPDDELLKVQTVRLTVPVEKIVSRRGVRTCCDECGEEIINEREVHQWGRTLCRSCSGDGYYQALTAAVGRGPWCDNFSYSEAVA